MSQDHLDVLPYATYELALVANELPLPAMVSSGMLIVVFASQPGYIKRS